MANYTWGTAAGKTGWLIQSTSENKGSQIGTVSDNNGEVAAYHVFDKQDDFSFDVVIPSDDSTGAPECGTVFTFDGVKYIITGVNKTRSNADYEKYSISGKRYITNGLPT